MCDSWELGNKHTRLHSFVLCASSAVWGLQLHVACVLLQAGGAACAGSRVCVWQCPDGSGRQLRLVG